ncbi:phosphate/phosphite/phosphonate ABC transporter substrate-binding protein [Chthonobacter albigriseus]|uniref:phosphate/phosphite/phosphonate ABC transporter substrate-binding protein n=1 Tax=Chthonobacter albigriseus TaxID=1683161 RepID=UPI0015EF99CB|nr:phosphate/phosphite/phosphonate ABC transporter substrate-binding protein [Chthonobacter albigriseus]
MLKSILAAAAMMATAIAAPAHAAETIRFAVTDVDGLEALQREFGPFKAAFEEKSGLAVEFFPVSGRTAAVEAMAADQVDFVLTGPAEYIVFRSRLGAEPVVGWQRPDYFAQIVVLADGPIQSVADLKGKTISFGEIGSTSQHLGPAQTLKDFGLVYNTDYTPAFVKRNVAVEALKRGDLGAIGMNFTHLQTIREKMPDVGLKVIARGPDLPNDLLLASPKVAPEVVAKVRQAFLDHGAELMKSVVENTDDNRKYMGGVFLPTVTDSDYEYVRAMYTTIGITEFNEFVGE